MKAHHYVAIAIRLFCIPLVIYSLRQSSILLEVIFTGEVNGMEASPLFVSFTVIFPLFICLVLWLFPMTFAKMIASKEIDQTVETISKPDMLTVGVICIGLFTTYYASIDSVYWMTLYHFASAPENYGGVGDLLTPDTKANMWATALELVVGLILILKAKAVSKLLLSVAK